jgi:hypothetical protein
VWSQVENGMERGLVTNYDEIRQDIVEALEMLRDSPIRDEVFHRRHL